MTFRGCAIVLAGLVAGFLLAGCQQADKVIQTYLDYKGKVTDQVVEGTVLATRTYCTSQLLAERRKYREWFVDRADADPTTRGMRLVITCPGE